MVYSNPPLEFAGDTPKQQKVEQVGATPYTGTKTVATAGTRVQLSATSVPCKRVFIQAYESNTGVITVGDASVVAASGTRQGRTFFPTQGDWFYVDDLNKLWLDATQSGEKVAYYYEV